MLSARQRLLMRRARDRAIDIAIAPLGTVVLLPDPDFRRRVFRRVCHVGLAFVARYVGRMDRGASMRCPIMIVWADSASRRAAEHVAEIVIDRVQVLRLAVDRSHL